MLNKSIVFLLITCVINFAVILSFVADMHELTLIHTDLKPENILLVSSEYLRVPDYKVCKFSWSTF